MTTNSGTNWIRKNIDSCFGPIYMNFLNINTGWISPGDSIHSTTNGGTSWVSKKSYHDELIMIFLISLDGMELKFQ